MSKMTYAELRKISLGAARSYLRDQGIDPAGVSADDALAALDDICRMDGALCVYVWYVQLDSTNQTQLFRREWRKWQNEKQEERRRAS